VRFGGIAADDHLVALVVTDPPAPTIDQVPNVTTQLHVLDARTGRLTRVIPLDLDTDAKLQFSSIEVVGSTVVAGPHGTRPAHRARTVDPPVGPLQLRRRGDAVDRDLVPTRPVPGAEVVRRKAPLARHRERRGRDQRDGQRRVLRHCWMPVDQR
jgi:hypothetical protein